jgi:hypothetical protein
MRFGDVLEAADQLSVDEQESLLEVLHRRIIERRREALANDIREAGQEYGAGECRASTPDEIVDEILS